MNLVDSSGWLEYFTDSSAAEFYEKALKDIHTLIVPTICLYEVFKVVLREKGEQEALQAVALMKQGHVVELTDQIAIRAAQISHRQKLPMADSLIYATALLHNAVLWTQDSDFKDIDGVNYIDPNS
ncbi:MAG: type II toxin-antitoxin system VapC family toxin [Candidatus Aminicenantes bacterium]|nr:type II toxin-antitoxin system VapC family toxin [Candidatus Aminicenantes bacterium]